MVVRLQANILGVIMYADDLILISASCTDLKAMIKICEVEMLWLDKLFNVKKSCLVRCGPGYSKNCVDVLLNGAPLRLCNFLKYLGIMFDVKRQLKVSLASKSITFLGRLIIFLAVLVLQLLVWYYVIF